MNVVINPGIIFKLLLSVILFLLFANITGLIARFNFGHDFVYGLVPLFDFNNEKNIPTFYSSLSLITASSLLLFISSAHKKLKDPYILWALLSLVFLFLSIDEISSIHERFSGPTRNLLGTSGFLYHAWVIPYFAFFSVFATIYFKFLLSLQKKIMVLFLIAGATFVLGAVGFEMLGGWEAEVHGPKGLLHSFFYTCEEFLEMLGVAIFIYSLLTYIADEFGSLKITICK